MSRFRGPIERTARSLGKRALAGLVAGFVGDSSSSRVELPLSTFRLARDAEGALCLGGVRLDALFGRFGSPLFVLDSARIEENARRFTARRAEVFASYKTNPVPGVLRALHARGIGAEAASPYELWLALRLGVPPGSIVFDGPAKTRESIALAVGRGVGLLNLNDRREVDFVADVARGLGVRARVGLRVVPAGTLGGQFGEPIEGGAALEAFRAARARPELEVVAMHAHANGELATEAALDHFVAPLLAFTDVLRRELHLDLEILDFGGNLPSPTVSRLPTRAQRLAMTFGVEPVARPVDSVLSIERYLEGLLARVDAHFASLGSIAPRVFLEPGRALMSDAQMLLCRVLSVRPSQPSRPSRPCEGGRVAVLDAGINVAEAVRSELHQLYPLVEPLGSERTLHRLVGPSCTLGDLLYPARSLPPLAPGDGLAIMDAGAYFVPYSTCFSFPRPGVVAVTDGSVELLRAPERFEDLVARDALDATAPAE